MRAPIPWLTVSPGQIGFVLLSRSGFVDLSAGLFVVCQDRQVLVVHEFIPGEVYTMTASTDVKAGSFRGI